MARHGAENWALWFGLVLAATFAALAPPRPAAYTAERVPFFESRGIDAVSYVEYRINTVAATEEAVAIKDDGPPLFGMDTEPLRAGNVLDKWSRANAEIVRELEALDRCHSNGPCPADAQRLIDLSAEGAGRSGRARVGLINRAVDRAISPVSDEAQWGVPDHWSAPFETLRSGRGDCEDYAIVKYLALLEAGIPTGDLKIVVLKNAFPNEDHAVVAARVDDQWLILDNRTLTLVRDMDLTRATPELMLDQQGVRRFIARDRSRRQVG